MNGVALLLAAILVSAIPVLWFEIDQRLSVLPEPEWSYTASLLLILPGTVGLILLSVPFAPAIAWAQPEPSGVLLMLATSPLLWGLGILLEAVSQFVGFALQAADVNPWEESESSDESSLMGPSPWVLIPVGSLVGGAEELLFRGVVLVWLVDGFGVAPGLLLNGVLFGLYHYPNSVKSVREVDGEAMREMSVSGAGGVVLGVLYLYTGNLLVPLVGHSLHNAGLFSVLHAQSSS